MYFNSIRFFLFWSLCCLCSCVYAQDGILEIPDSLKNKTYDYLYTMQGQNVEDTISSKMYLNACLYKATLTNDSKNKARALNELSYYVKSKEVKLDLIKKSLIESHSLDSIYSIAAYNNLGLYYLDYHDYDKALTEYLRVLRLSKKYKYKTYEVIATTNIAELKTNIGKHEEALELYKKCYEIEKNKNPIEDVAIVDMSLYLANSFRNNKKYDSASYYYHSVIDKIEKKYPYFLSIAKINEGANLFYKKEYQQAKILLEEGASLINTNSAFYLKYYIISQFYLGKIHQFSDNQHAIDHFLKVDSLLTKVDIVIPEVRDTYVSLLTEHTKNNSYEEQLHVINKLMKFDSIKNAIRISMGEKLNAEFDTPELLKSKEIVIQKLENKNQNLNLKFVLLLILFLIITGIIIIQFRRHRLYKLRFENLLNESNNTTKEVPKVDVEKTFQNLNIDPKTVSLILNKLQVFETKKGFLKNGITVTLLAKKLSTNTKYLSRIINIYKGKTFIHYINDLRVEYILDELKVNTTLQRYTILGIAKEASFNSAESFTAAFKKKTGITPSYYIKNLKKQKIVS